MFRKGCGFDKAEAKSWLGESISILTAASPSRTLENSDGRFLIRSPRGMEQWSVIAFYTQIGATKFVCDRMEEPWWARGVGKEESSLCSSREAGGLCSDQSDESATKGQIQSLHGLDDYWLDQYWHEVPWSGIDGRDGVKVLMTFESQQPASWWLCTWFCWSFVKLSSPIFSPTTMGVGFGRDGRDTSLPIFSRYCVVISNTNAVCSG